MAKPPIPTQAINAASQFMSGMPGWLRNTVGLGAGLGVAANFSDNILGSLKNAAAPFAKPGGFLQNLYENAKQNEMFSNTTTGVRNFFVGIMEFAKVVGDLVTGKISLGDIMSGKVSASEAFSSTQGRENDAEALAAAQDPNGPDAGAGPMAGLSQEQIVGAAAVGVPLTALAALGVKKVVGGMGGGNPAISGVVNPNGFTTAKPSFMSAAQVGQIQNNFLKSGLADDAVRSASIADDLAAIKAGTYTAAAANVADDAAKAGLRATFGNATSFLKNMGPIGKGLAIAGAVVGGTAIANQIVGDEPSDVAVTDPNATAPDAEGAQANLLQDPGNWLNSLGADISSVVKDGQLDWNALGSGSVNNGRAVSDGLSTAAGGTAGFLTDMVNVSENFLFGGLGWNVIPDNEKSYTEMWADGVSDATKSVVGEADYSGALAQTFYGAGAVAGTVLTPGAAIKGGGMVISGANMGLGLVRNSAQWSTGMNAAHLAM